MKKMVGVFIVLCLLAVLLPFTEAHAQATQASIGFEPNAVTLSTGATSEVAVSIQDMRDLYAFDVTVRYDPAYIEIIDADPTTDGIQVSQGTFLEGGMAIKNSVDPQAGTISYVTTQLNPSMPRSGSGVLLVIRLRGKKDGATNLSFGDVQLSTRDGNAIPFNANEAAVTIGQTAPAGPTPTPFAIVTPKAQYEAGPTAASNAPATPEAGAPSATKSPSGRATLAPTYTPTVSAASGSALTPTPTLQAQAGLFENWSLFSIVSTILELAVVVILVVFLLRRRKPKKAKKKAQP
jgi:hypothetical protein